MRLFFSFLWNAFWESYWKRRPTTGLNRHSSFHEYNLSHALPSIERIPRFLIFSFKEVEGCFQWRLGKHSCIIQSLHLLFMLHEKHLLCGSPSSWVFREKHKVKNFELFALQRTSFFEKNCRQSSSFIDFHRVIIVLAYFLQKFLANLQYINLKHEKER